MAQSREPKTSRLRVMYNVLLLSTVSAVAMPAWAQGDIADDAAAAAGPAAEEEVIVTAQKRRQRLQEVPAAITALSSKVLDDRQLNTVEDISSSVPNLQFTELNGVTVVAIRGVAPEGNSPSLDPSTAQHIDGVYQPRPTNMNLQMADIESIEVLRGPQGTLYGRNATGGVINYILKGPADEFAAGVEFTVGNYGRRQFKGYVTGPVTEGLSARVSALLDSHDGTGLNLFNNKRLGGQDVKGIRAALEFDAIENLTVNLSAYYIDFEEVGPQIYAFSPLSGPEVDRFAPLSLLQTTAPRRVYSSFDPFTKSTQLGITGSVAYDISDTLSVKSVTGYIDSDYNSVFDTAPLAVSISSADYDYHSKFFSQEFNLNAKLFDVVDAVFGLYYMREEFDQNALVPFPNGLIALGRVPTISVNRMPEETTSKAAFADFTYNLTDDFRLIGGIRYTEDRKEVVQSVYYTGIFASCMNRESEAAYTSTTGRIGVQYDFAENLTGYATWQSGFKAGGFNVSGCGDRFDPEKIQSYEAGLKGSMWNRRVNFSLSGFYYDAQDFQVTKLVSVNGALSAQVENAAGATIAGLELEATFALTGDWKVDVTAAYTHSEYNDYESFYALGGRSVDLDGFQLVKTPEYTFKIGSEYTFAPADGFLMTLRGEVFHSAKIWYTPFHEEIAAQNDPFTIVNAFVTVEPDDGGYRISAYAKNIFDEKYRTGANTSTLYRVGRGYWNDPPTYGVTFAFNF